MRDILFRGKRTDNGEWVYGSFIPDFLEASNIDNQKEMEDRSERGFIMPLEKGRFMQEVERKTVGIYIGRNDKNGVKIFEWDILKYNGENFTVMYLKSHAAFLAILHRVVFTANCPALLHGEVIGNIHDNPELLKGGDHGA